jgi:hypothetical protein
MLLVVTPGLKQALRRDRYVKRGSSAHLLSTAASCPVEYALAVLTGGLIGASAVRWRRFGFTSTTASGTHRDVLRSVFEFPDGRRGGARIYAMYCLDWKRPVGGVGKLAGDSGGGGGQ